MKIVHGACPHDCPDTCAWQVNVNDKGIATELKGDPDHPFTRGSLCTKLKRYRERVYHKDRILYPLMRSGRKGDGKFVRISWEQATDVIINKLQDGLKTHGPLTAMPSNFAGTIGIFNAMLEINFSRDSEQPGSIEISAGTSRMRAFVIA